MQRLTEKYKHAGNLFAKDFRKIASKQAFLGEMFLWLLWIREYSFSHHHPDSP